MISISTPKLPFEQGDTPPPRTFLAPFHIASNNEIFPRFHLSFCLERHKETERKKNSRKNQGLLEICLHFSNPPMTPEDAN